MKFWTRTCNCSSFEKERDFYKRKRKEYEQQLIEYSEKDAEQERLLTRAQKEITYLKDLISQYADRETEKDNEEAIERQDLSKDANIPTEDDEKKSEADDAPQIPSNEDSPLLLPLEDIIIKVEPEDVMNEFEHNSDSHFTVDTGQTTKDQPESPLSAADEKCYQMCRWVTRRRGKGPLKVCNEVCTTTRLVGHIAEAHVEKSNNSKTTCLWEDCWRRRPFKYKRDLLRHVHTHTLTEKYSCCVRHCRRRFFTRGDLEMHKVSHVMEVPIDRYPCSYEGCDKVLPSINHLKQHEACHTNPEIPCSQPGCSKVFRNVAMLDVHCRRYHYYAKEGLPAVAMRNPRVKASKTTQCCCVDECSAKAQVGKISLHIFPRDPEANRKWLLNLNMPSVPKYFRVCSKHFLPDDFFPNPPGWPVGKRLLKPEAVPTQFIPRQTCKITLDNSG